MDDPRSAHIPAIIARKCLRENPAGLADFTAPFKHCNNCVQYFTILSIQAWAEPGYDVAEIMAWLAEVIEAPADCVLDDSVRHITPG